MTQPEEAVGGSDEPIIAAEPTLEDRFAAFGEQAEEPEVAEETTEEAPEAEAEEPEITEEDVTEEEAEVELPPIDPPVSWSADKKEEFKSLPRSLQETISQRETEREKFVQTKAQEAAQARQAAEREALSQVAEIERQALEQLKQFAPQLPEKPDPRLLNGTDDHRAYYYQQLAVYEEAAAQQQTLQQAATERSRRLAQYEQEIERREAEAFKQALADNLPDYLDPTNGPKLQQELGSIALELGYSAEQIAEARAPDILAMHKASQWKAKAAKYDTLMAKKMEQVRAAKQLPKVAKPGTAQPKGAVANQRYTADRNAMKSGDTEAAKRVFSNFI